MKFSVSLLALAMSASTFAASNMEQTQSSSRAAGSFGGNVSIAGGYSTLFLTDQENVSGDLSYSVEAMGNYKLNHNTLYQLGLGYTSNGFSGTVSNTELSVSINYFQIIFGSVIEASPKADIFFNSYLGLPLSASASAKGVTVELPSSFVDELSTTVGMSLGGNYNITPNIFAGARINYDLLPVINADDDNWAGVQAVLGYKF